MVRWTTRLFRRGQQSQQSFSRMVSHNVYLRFSSESWRCKRWYLFLEVWYPAPFAFSRQRSCRGASIARRGEGRGPHRQSRLYCKLKDQRSLAIGIQTWTKAEARGWGEPPALLTPVLATDTAPAVRGDRGALAGFDYQPQ